MNEALGAMHYTLRLTQRRLSDLDFQIVEIGYRLRSLQRSMAPGASMDELHRLVQAQELAAAAYSSTAEAFARLESLLAAAEAGRS